MCVQGNEEMMKTKIKGNIIENLHDVSVRNLYKFVIYFKLYIFISF